MVLYLYNESQKNLMITSLDGRTTMVTEDNSCFKEILEMCKDPNADFDLISILLNENYWDYTSENGRVLIQKNDDDIYFVMNGTEEPLPSYLKQLIIDRKDSKYLDKYKENICNFLEARHYGRKSDIDSYLSKNKFTITPIGAIIGQFSNGNFKCLPMNIRSYREDDHDERWMVDNKEVQADIPYRLVDALSENDVKFIITSDSKQIEAKALNGNLTKYKFWKFWQDKFGIAEHDNESIAKKIKNKQVQEVFKLYLTQEFDIYEEDVLEELVKNSYSEKAFLRCYWES